MPLLGCDLNDIAIRKRMTQWHHLPIYFRAHTLMTNVGMNAIGKVDRGRSAGQRQHFALRRKGVNLLGIEIHFERGKKLRGLAHLASPFDQLPHPHHALIVFRRIRAVFIPPVRGYSLLRDAVHLMGANLHFKWLPSMNDSSM